ncbi:hypothetical protein DSL72_003938 [Monilinia vaccinii-corymbosi]|uniref:Uncharacterized protein n=1 Tax=Monilinia vaccinii-corymbosi TaxID=61207 RepID=A0A8A3P0Y1_9HELO|nr:hypothetical protein DSL72_003938 [Monilinia vaccinii-corymbosi]
MATKGSRAFPPDPSFKKAADIKCVKTTKGWVCAICFPLDDPSRALERVLNLNQLQAHAAANHYASLGPNEWDNYVQNSVYYEAQFKGQSELALDGDVMQGPPIASRKNLAKQAGVPKRKYVRKAKTAVNESAFDLMESMINFDGKSNVNNDHFTGTNAFPGGSQDKDSETYDLGSTLFTPHPSRTSSSFYGTSAHSQFGMGVSEGITTPNPAFTDIGSYYDHFAHFPFEMGLSPGAKTPTPDIGSYYDQSGNSELFTLPSTTSCKKSSGSMNPLRQRLSENPSFESAVSFHGLDRVRAAGSAGLQRYLDRQARGLPRTANASLSITSPSPSRNGTLGLPLTAANYAAAGMPNLHVEKVARRSRKVDLRRQASRTSSIAGGAEGDASPSYHVGTINTSLNRFGVPATLFGQAPGAAAQSHAYQSIYAVPAPKEQLPLPEASLPEIPSGLYLPELARAEDAGTVATSLEQFEGEVFGTSEPIGMGNDVAGDFAFESFPSEPWPNSEENEAALGNAVPPMSSEDFAEFLATISNPAYQFDAMFGFGNRSDDPSDTYDNFMVFHTTSLEYGVALETIQAARPASSSSRSPSSGEIALVAGPSTVESVAEVSAPVAETRTAHTPEMADVAAFFQKQLEEQRIKVEADLQKQLKVHKAIMKKKKMEEQSAALEKLARCEKAREEAAATCTAKHELLCLEARQKRSKMSSEQLFGMVSGRTVGNGKPTVTTGDDAKKRVGPSKKPVPVKNHSPVVKEAVTAANKATISGNNPVSATVKEGAPRAVMTTFSLTSQAPAGYKREFVENHGVKVAVNKSPGAAFQKEVTSTPAKATVPTQSASAPKKRAAISVAASFGQKPTGVKKKGSSREPVSDRDSLVRAMLKQKAPTLLNVRDGNGGVDVGQNF